MCERLPLDKADSPSHDLVLPPKANKQTVKTKLKLDPLCKSFMQIFVFDAKDCSIMQKVQIASWAEAKMQSFIKGNYYGRKYQLTWQAQDHASGILDLVMRHVLILCVMGRMLLTAGHLATALF